MEHSKSEVSGEMKLRKSMDDLRDELSQVFSEPKPSDPTSISPFFGGDPDSDIEVAKAYQGLMEKRLKVEFLFGCLNAYLEKYPWQVDDKIRFIDLETIRLTLIKASFGENQLVRSFMITEGGKTHYQWAAETFFLFKQGEFTQQEKTALQQICRGMYTTTIGASGSPEDGKQISFAVVFDQNPPEGTPLCRALNPCPRYDLPMQRRFFLAEWYECEWHGLRFSELPREYLILDSVVLLLTLGDRNHLHLTAMTRYMLTNELRILNNETESAFLMKDSETNGPDFFHLLVNHKHCNSVASYPLIRFLENNLDSLRDSLMKVLACLPEAPKVLSHIETRSLLRMLAYLRSRKIEWTQKQKDIIDSVVEMYHGIIPEVTLLLDEDTLLNRVMTLMAEKRLWENWRLLDSSSPSLARLGPASMIILLRQLPSAAFESAAEQLFKYGMLHFLLRFLKHKETETMAVFAVAVRLVDDFRKFYLARMTERERRNVLWTLEEEGPLPLQGDFRPVPSGDGPDLNCFLANEQHKRQTEGTYSAYVLAEQDYEVVVNKEIKARTKPED
jgi:hypothetical protein